MRPEMEKRPPELQQLELSEYITAFKSSSDRARYVIYVNAVVSLLILICTWNTMPWSWAQKRITTAEKGLRESLGREFDRLHSGKGTVKTPEIPADREAYIGEKVRLDRAVKFRETGLESIEFVQVPLVGAHIDVNDLGLLGGVTLLVLTMLLGFSMVRQHENLYLAFFKIRRLCERDPQGHHDGESMANFLYHALAMGQVLNYPPTLARWSHGHRNRVVGLVRWAVLCLPAFVQALVFGYNLRTFYIARSAWSTMAYFRMGAQSVLLLLIFFGCMLSSLYSRACNYRWRTAFDLVNPGLARMEPRPLLEWLHFSPHMAMETIIRFIRKQLGSVNDAKNDTPEVPSQLLGELTYTLRPTEPVSSAHEHTVGPVFHPVSQDESGRQQICQKDLRELATEIQKQVNALIQTEGGGTVVNYEAQRNTFDGSKWVVVVTFKHVVPSA